MRWVNKYKIELKLLAVCLSVTLAVPGFSSELKYARILPEGKITIYSGDQKIGEYRKEAPLPIGYLISSDGRCYVKTDGLYLVAEDKSLFSVDAVADRKELLIKNGTLYFALSKMPHSLSFITPAGIVAAREILLNAAAGSRLLKGYVSVQQGESEVGIIEGGSMMVSTQQGDMMIKSGRKIKLAQADMDIGPPKDKEEDKEKVDKKQEEKKKPGMSKNVKITLGVVGTLALLGAFAALGGGGGGGGGGESVSPFSP
jgi:hypothetical protein